MPPLPFGRAAVACLALGVFVALGACGRRGALEAPPDASAPAKPASKVAPARTGRNAASQDEATRAGRGSLQSQPNATVEDTPDDETDEADPTALVTPPTPQTHKGKRSYVIPKDPFILDPLL